jgi:hypothetical protein
MTTLVEKKNIQANERIPLPLDNYNESNVAVVNATAQSTRTKRYLQRRFSHHRIFFGRQVMVLDVSFDYYFVKFLKIRANERVPLRQLQQSTNRH